jgi:uncharacterized damage-inducible protein DinB
MAQIDDDAFFASPGPATNSIAIVVKHMAGNLRSRWTNFLTEDGEKDDRDRDGEFELRPGDTRTSLMDRWEAGWRLAFDELARLSDDDTGRIVMIRWEATSVLDALHRQMAHAAYHIGQITLLARHYAADWRSLSIPIGQSEIFNEKKRKQAETGRLA